jgi:hypothetical protein
MGIELCDEQMGTAQGIEDLVDRRFQKMQNELAPFRPDPFGRYGKENDNPNVPQVGDDAVESELGEEVPLASPDWFAADMGQGSARLATGGATENDSGEELPLARPGLMNENSDAWTDDLNNSDSSSDSGAPDSPSYAPAQRSRPRVFGPARRTQRPISQAAPPRSSSIGSSPPLPASSSRATNDGRAPLSDMSGSEDDSPQAWEQLESELVEYIEDYESLHEGRGHGVRYHDTVLCIEHAIKVARMRPEVRYPRTWMIRSRKRSRVL